MQKPIPKNQVFFWDKIIFLSFCALFFFTPLMLTPLNYELFEFNKIVFVYFWTIVILCAWAGKMIASGKFIFKRTFWDKPLLVFFASQAISTIISIDRHTSIFGYYSRFNGGLLSTACYLLLYWALTSNIGSNKKADPTNQSKVIVFFKNDSLLRIFSFRLRYCRAFRHRQKHLGSGCPKPGLFHFRPAKLAGGLS
ncbi:MAG: hypothetical protein ABH867_01225 [Patescibacteria group bacterium]